MRGMGGIKRETKWKFFFKGPVYLSYTVFLVVIFYLRREKKLVNIYDLNFFSDILVYFDGTEKSLVFFWLK